MTKHTKWKSGLMGQSEDDTEIWYVRSEDSDPMDVIFGGPDVCICTSESIANQIAAAPDILDALEKGEQLIAGDKVGVEWKKACRAFLAESRAAIAKAKGQ